MTYNFGNPTIITKRNVDTNKNPISVSLTETKQVIDIHNCIPTNQSIDRNYGVDIEGLYEVFNSDEIENDNFYVDYEQGVIYFHSSRVGESITYRYKGVGYSLISASKVFTKIGAGGEILETLEEVIDEILAAKDDIDRREKLRIENENRRIDNENIRIANEKKRIEKENKRVTDENTRKTSENTRIQTENERIQSENDRETAENIRESNENQRITDENIRLDNERRRGSYDAMLQEALTNGSIVEVVNARSNDEGDVFPTLKERLDNSDKKHLRLTGGKLTGVLEVPEIVVGDDLITTGKKKATITTTNKCLSLGDGTEENTLEIPINEGSLRFGGKKVFHEGNSAPVTMTNLRQGDESADSFSNGISIMTCDDKNGWPVPYATILGVQGSNYNRQFQLLANNLNNTFAIRTSHNTMTSDNKWSDWSRIFHENMKNPRFINGLGMGSCYYSGISAYDYTNGIFVKTDLESANQGVIDVKIHGSGFSSSPIDITVQFRNNSNQAIDNLKAVGFGSITEIKAFNYGGYVCLWFAQPARYSSIRVDVGMQGDWRGISCTLSNQALPTSGVTGLSTTTLNNVAVYTSKNALYTPGNSSGNFHFGTSTAGSAVFSRGDGGLFVKQYTDDKIYANVTAADLKYASEEKWKKNIKELDFSAADVINNTTIYEYNLKSDANENTNYGVVIDRGVPEELIQEIVNEDGSIDRVVSSYGMTSLAWKGLQEHSEQISVVEEETAYAMLDSVIKDREIKSQAQAIEEQAEQIGIIEEDIAYTILDSAKKDTLIKEQTATIQEQQGVIESQAEQIEMLDEFISDILLEMVQIRKTGGII